MSLNRCNIKLTSNEQRDIEVSSEPDELRFAMSMLLHLAKYRGDTRHILLIIAAFIDFETLHSLMVEVDRASKEKEEYGLINKVLKSGNAATSIWYNKISALQKIDPGIRPENCPENKFAQYTIHHALATYKRQKDEISYLKSKYPEDAVWKEFNIEIEFKENCTITQLKRLDKFLDEFNTVIIKNHINTDSTQLLLKYVGITRIPERIFDDEGLTEYWSKLVSLEISNNFVQRLPKNILKLKSLQEIACASNVIDLFPEELTEIKTLKRINFRYNHLSYISENIGKLSDLEDVNFSYNTGIKFIPTGIKLLNKLRLLNFMFCSIEKLPEEMGDISMLNEIYFKANRIQSLPEWLSRLHDTHRVEVDFRWNRIKKISDPIRLSLGNIWANSNLDDQCLPSNPCILRDLACDNNANQLEFALSHDKYDIDQLNYWGESPLYLAFICGSVEAARVLLQYGANSTRVVSELEKLKNDNKLITHTNGKKMYNLFVEMKILNVTKSKKSFLVP